MSEVVPEHWTKKRLSEFSSPRRGTTYVASELSEDKERYPLYINMKSFKVGGGYNEEGDKYFSSPYSPVVFTRFPIEPEMSSTITKSFGPVTAAAYQGRYLGSYPSHQHWVFMDAGYCANSPVSWPPKYCQDVVEASSPCTVSPLAFLSKAVPAATAAHISVLTFVVCGVLGWILYPKYAPVLILNASLNLKFFGLFFPSLGRVSE